MRYLIRYKTWIFVILSQLLLLGVLISPAKSDRPFLQSGEETQRSDDCQPVVANGLFITLKHSTLSGGKITYRF